MSLPWVTGTAPASFHVFSFPECKLELRRWAKAERDARMYPCTSTVSRPRFHLQEAPPKRKRLAA